MGGGRKEGEDNPRPPLLEAGHQIEDLDWTDLQRKGKESSGCWLGAVFWKGAEGL